MLFCPHKLHNWTLDKLDWRPWVNTVDVNNLTPDQTEVLEEAPGGLAKIGNYYAMLAHDPAILRERTRLFNAVMYGRGGAPRAVHELAAVAGSRYNGCVYCASVHARLYNDLTKTTEVIKRLFEGGVDAHRQPKPRRSQPRASRRGHVRYTASRLRCATGLGCE